MPERFGFACFLSGQRFQTPAKAISAAAAAFPNHIGRPIETMVLDVQSGRQEVRPWPGGEMLLGHPAGLTEQLFTYYASVGNSTSRVCIGFGQASAAATITISFPDMAMATLHAEVAEACGRLHRLCLSLCTRCVVAVGGEIGFDEAHETTTKAVVAMISSSSVARWVASDAESLPLEHPGFEPAGQFGTALVIR